MLLHKTIFTCSYTRLNLTRLVIMKVRTCDSFTICTLVDLPLYVISISELVIGLFILLLLLAANQPSIFICFNLYKCKAF